VKLLIHKVAQWARKDLGAPYGGYLRGIMVENENYLTTGELPWNVRIAMYMWHLIRKQEKLNE